MPDSNRRRIYLMRHGDVAYFDESGRPLPPDEVGLTEAGMAQAVAAGAALAALRFDRVITSGLPRAVETARLALERMGKAVEIESWPELRELRGGRLREIPDDELESEFLAAFQGLVPESTRFLRGESIGELLDRVLPAFDGLVVDQSWDTVLMVLHGGVNRAILSRALLGGRGFLGSLAQSPGCINVIDMSDTGGHWIVRAVNYTPMNPAHIGERLDTMAILLEQYLVYRQKQ